MKKKLLKVISLLTTTLSVAVLSAQTQKFDIASFVAPEGWQRIDTNGTVAFLQSKTINGQTSFCQIILYPSNNSAASADKNFKTAWQNLVTVPTKSKANPITQTEKTPDGWTAVTGAANISLPGIRYNTIVSSLTGFGKTMSVQVNTAGGDYTSTVEKFFNDLDLDSKAIVNSNQQNNNSSVSNQTNKTGMITINDYDFITPEQWLFQKNKDHFSIQNPGSGCTIKILEPQPSSGDLEKDANAVFDLMYTGWQYQKSGVQQYTVSKGFLYKGLEYCRKEAAMSMTDANGNYNLEEGSAMAVKANNQIVIIAVRHNSSMMAHDACYRNYNTWKRFFNSFTVKNTAIPKNTEDVASRIIGAWSQTESGASSEYVFAANGNYAFNGALGTSYTGRDYNYEYLYIKTYAFQGDGNYSVNGSQLALKKRTGTTEQMQVRFEKVNYGGTGWKYRMYLLNKISYGENEVSYDKKDK